MRPRLPISESCLKSKYIFNRKQLTYNPEELYAALIEEYNPDHRVEFIIVKSAWYGKRTLAAEHEFILIQVEDTVKGLTNYLVLERDPGDTSRVPSGIIAHARAAFQGTAANDTFKVSYDGNKQELLAACRLESCIYLEKLEFHSEEPLLLYKLVTLAVMVTQRYPYYHIVFSNCYFFAGLIWECMRKMCPRADHEYIMADKRGKYHAVPFASINSKVSGVYSAALNKLRGVESKLEAQRSRWKTLEMLERLERLEKEVVETSPTE